MPDSSTSAEIIKALLSYVTFLSSLIKVLHCLGVKQYLLKKSIEDL